MKIPKLRLVPVGIDWWIVGDDDAGPMGPYETKPEAESDKRGLTRGYRYGDEPGFTCSETQTSSEEVE